MQFAIDRRAAGLDIRDVEKLPVRAAGKPGSDRLAHGGAGAIAAGEVAGMKTSSWPCGPRSRALM